MTSVTGATRAPLRSRYIQLTVLIFAAAAIYPLLYLRQNFEVSMLEAFNITNTQLGQCYSLLGVLFVATYLPSGWLADRFKPRSLLSFSLAGTGLLGIWYWTLPPFWALQIIFAGWGITTGLTFWAALIKETTMLAGTDHQGRFFGILEGGRGVVEAVLGSIAVAWFAWAISSLAASTPAALQQVILLYVVALLVMAPVTWLMLSDIDHEAAGHNDEIVHTDNIRDAKLILAKPEVWLAALCILCGYALFYSTYSFAGYLQTELSLPAVMVGWITVGRLWMRPIGGVLAGFVGDCFRVERVLAILLAGCALSLATMIFLPASASIALILAVVLVSGLFTYSVRGIYWGTLNACDIPNRTKGLAIGIISLIGYSPEIWVPLLNGYLVDTYPGRMGYGLYFGSIAALGLLGAASAWQLVRLSDRRAHTSLH